MTDPVTPTVPTPAPAPEPPAEPKTFTQEDVDKIAATVRKDLRDENATMKAELEALTPKAAEYDQLKAAQMTEAEKARADAEAERTKRTALESELAARELDALRLKVAADANLPAALAARLTGSNEDEMKADAESLLKLIPAQSGGVPKPAGATDPQEAAEVDPFLAGLTGKATVKPTYPQKE